MTPSQAAQEKPTSPRTYDLDTDSGRELHQRIHPNGGRCPMLDGGPCIWQQRVKQVEREAAAATPDEAYYKGWTAGYYKAKREAAGKDSPATPSLDVIRGEPEGATEALRHLFFVVERLDKQAEPPYSADRMVKITTEAWRGLVRPAIEIVRARLDEGSATPDQGKGEPR